MFVLFSMSEGRFRVRLLFDRTCKCMLFLFSLSCDRLHVHLTCRQFHRTDYMCGWLVLCSSEQIAHLSGLSSALMDRLDICFVLFHRTACVSGLSSVSLDRWHICLVLCCLAHISFLFCI